MFDPNNSTLMRKRVWISCVVVLFGCLFLLFRRATEPPTAISQQQIEPTTNAPSQPERPKAVETSQSTNVPNVLKVVPRPSETEFTKDLQRRMLAGWQRPIEFYGKVVDEKSNPVEGASISF